MNVVKDVVSRKIAIDTEQEVRLNLTAVYRLLSHFGMDDLIFTHASARIPGEDAFLINPFGLMFREITPETLVKIDYEGRILGRDTNPANAAGFVIHSAILKDRPDLDCVIHTHTRAGVALSCLADGLMPINQFAIEFYDRIGYHDYEGIAFNLDEGPRLHRDLAQNVALVLRNHGLLTVGANIPAAFYFMYYLEQAARVQMDVLASGRKIVEPPLEVVKSTARQYTSAFNPPAAGHRMWPSLLRLLDQVDPGWRGA
ncbi:class II aldolase/adducin family protein [Oleomonas cavernae]|uniref:Class II aldolase/adducin family protein n=1 Tax=Oleomonas cavernae TaxID=2320859 RepID=A0A418WTY3_9PROT|nr:class II aldolase/adducin family protein [Oleomonas cavernae]RJF94733.1 class II aldolase/adducin family protein [Oleomonas cavernae]